MTHITEKAMMVHVCISQWSGRKLDKGASRDLADMKKAQAGLARVYKDLVKSEHLDRFRQCGGQMRGLVYELTMPWLDGGTRVLPNMLMDKFISEYRDIKAAADAAANRFAAEYAHARKRAEQELGDLFNENDYPPVELIRSKFAIRLTRLPIPVSSNDVRLSDEEDHIVTLTKSVDVAVFHRLGQMAQRLIKAAGREDSTVRESLIEYVHDMIEIVPKLNITDNPEIAKIVITLKKELSGLTREGLKDDPAVRGTAFKLAMGMADNVRKQLSILGAESDEAPEVADDKAAAPKVAAKSKPVAAPAKTTKTTKTTKTAKKPTHKA
jgi:hypothetical protein